MHSRGVNSSHRGHLHDEESRTRGGRPDLAQDAVPDVRAVGEVHRGVHSHDQDLRGPDGLGVLLDVAVDGRPREAAKGRHVREGRLVNDVQQRQAHGDPQAVLRAEEQRAGEGDKPDQEVHLVDLEEEEGLPEVQEPLHTRDNDGRQRALGHVGEGRRDKQEGDDHREARDQPGQGRRGACVAADGRAAEGPRRGVRVEPPPHEVGDPQRPELLVGVDVVLVLRGEGPGDGDGLHEPDDGAQDGRGDEPPHVVAVERAPPGKRLPGQA